MTISSGTEYMRMLRRSLLLGAGTSGAGGSGSVRCDLFTAGSASAMADHLRCVVIVPVTRNGIKIVAYPPKCVRHRIARGTIDAVQRLVEQGLADGLQLFGNGLGGLRKIELPCAAILRVAAPLDQITLFETIDHSAGRDRLHVEP